MCSSHCPRSGLPAAVRALDIQEGSPGAPWPSRLPSDSHELRGQSSSLAPGPGTASAGADPLRQLLQWAGPGTRRTTLSPSVRSPSGLGVHASLPFPASPHSRRTKHNCPLPAPPPPRTSRPQEGPYELPGRPGLGLWALGLSGGWWLPYSMAKERTQPRLFGKGPRELGALSRPGMCTWCWAAAWSHSPQRGARWPGLPLLCVRPVTLPLPAVPPQA